MWHLEDSKVLDMLSSDIAQFNRKAWISDHGQGHEPPPEGAHGSQPPLLRSPWWATWSTGHSLGVRDRSADAVRPAPEWRVKGVRCEKPPAQNGCTAPPRPGGQPRASLLIAIGIGGSL